ncbi:MAG: hypothetical protein RL042_732 [Nitrospirota bacterium]|jgi:hypothetical protein
MEDLKFKLERAKNTPVSDEEILNDLKRVSSMLNSSKVTQKLYGEHGQYDYSNVGRRFGTWNKALEAAGLSLSNQYNISDEALFENILLLWQHYGRQPRRAELAQPPSTISQSAYNRRFKSWVVALEHFVEYANSADVSAPTRAEEKTGSRPTGRDPSLRLREGLINSRFHSELYFWGSRQDEFGGQPLFREPFGGAPPLSDGPPPASGHMFPTFPPRAAVVPRTDLPSRS